MDGTDLRARGVLERGRAVRVWVDGRPVKGFEGESVAALLIVEGRLAFRRSLKSASARGYYCGMGICHECLVTVDGTPNTQACMTRVRDGLRIDTEGSTSWSAGR
jgi:predicted molibdopterin-dependent oxidoreductase YjgC